MSKAVIDRNAVEQSVQLLEAAWSAIDRNWRDAGRPISDREELEQYIAQLEALQSRDIEIEAILTTVLQKLKYVLQEADTRQLLTTSEAAEALGVRSVNTIKYWCKTGYIRGVKRNERTMIPLSEIERIRDADQVQAIRASDKLDEATSDLGRLLTDAELTALKVSRPGTTPWEQ